MAVQPTKKYLQTNKHILKYNKLRENGDLADYFAISSLFLGKQLYACMVYMWRLFCTYSFRISHAFYASEMLYFVIVAFPRYLHVYFSCLLYRRTIPFWKGAYIKG